MSPGWWTRNWALFLLLSLNYVSGISLEENGPRFMEDFSRSVVFSSRSGVGIKCRAHGTPKPVIQWITKDFLPVINLTAIREVEEDGTLQFPAFDAADFRADVYSSTYRCRASNSVGSILSPEIHLRAVVDASYEIENRDVSVLRGNTAILRCSVPQQVRDLVSVVSWVQDSTLNIYPNFQTGKYSLLPNGDLYVFSVDSADAYKTFACRTSHRLTNEARTSSASRIIVQDPEQVEGIKLTVPKQRTLRVKAGEDVYLPCAASGHPAPTYMWFLERDGKLEEMLGSYLTGSSGSRHSAHLGPILLSQVRAEDSGKVFVCWVNNSISQDTARVQLNVYVPIHVQISPRSQVIDVGRTATFRCIISGNPIDSIEWLKDGKTLSSSSRFTLSANRLELRVTSVHPDDSGMFQCLAANDLTSAQDSAQLRLGSILPELIYRFSEQTLQPGPSVSLKCTAVGNPPPQFQWTLDGFPLPESERYLVGQYVTIHDNVISHVNITNVEGADGGLVTCTAQNSMGAVSHSARLNIYGPPFIRPIRPVKAVSGKQLQIQCPVSGYPIDSITWERAGTLLPVNRRQRVYPNGTLIIDQVQQGEDEGIYGCEARNRQGLSSTRDLHIQVIVSPKIMPFQFMSQLLREGMRASVSCSVIEGDMPLEFTWTFDGKELSPHSTSLQGLRITFPDEYSSTLVIDSLSSTHSGLYGCIAQNSAGRDQHETGLTVNVPPKWTLEPRDINVSAGHSIALHCQAEGYPTPAILWKRALGTQPGEYKDVSGSWTGIFVNGTIRFDEVRKVDEGQYLCEARNGVGSGLSKVIFLKVNAPAQFLDRDQQISVRVKEKAILQCRARGDLPIEIQWSSKHAKITPQFNPRYMTRQQDLDEGAMSELIITDISRDDGGIYSCRASNMFGIDQTAVLLNVQEPPGQPVHVRMIEQKSRSVRLSWAETFNGNSPLISFMIQYKLPAGERWNEAEVEEVVVPGSQSTVNLEGLLPSTTYHIRILASNNMGLSPPSELIQVTTAEEVPEAPPEDLRITPVSSTRLKLTWAPPPKNLWHGSILGYYLGYREIGLGLSSDSGTELTTSHYAFNSISSQDTAGYHFKTVEVGIDFGGSSTLEDLRKFTRYAVVVQAFNSQGPGPSSTPQLATTLPDTPSAAPEGIVCIPTSSQSLQLTWDDPPLENRHGVIEGYRVKHELEEPDLETSQQEIKVTSAKSTHLHGLRKWTNYSVSVLAYTSAGDGMFSKPLICSTHEDVPSPPANIKAVVSSRRSILVAWLPPEKPNGRIEKYTIYIKMEANKVEKKNLESEERTYSAAGLKENTQYEFWVTAWTAMGEGGPSARVKLSTSSKVGGKIASFSQRVDVGWRKEATLPCESVGIPEPNLLWKFNGNHVELSSRKHINSAGTLRILDSSPEDEGNYTCSVGNPFGSDTVTYQVRVQVPPPPPTVQILESLTDALRLGWTVPSTGGSPIKGFVLHFKNGDGDWEEKEAGPGTSSYTLNGLRCGSKYQIFLTAVNKIGTGLPSPVLQAQTKGNVPAAPKKSEVLSGNASSITIRLDKWTELSCPIIRYALDYKAAENTNWIHVPAQFNGETKTYTISGLQANSKYNLRLGAENAAGRTTANFDFMTSPSFDGIPWSESGESSTNSDDSNLNTPLLIVFPSLLALFAVTGVLGVMCYFRRKRLGYEPKTVIGDSPGGPNTYSDTEMMGVGGRGGGRDREPRYCPVKTSDPSTQMHSADIPDYGEDVCPYATFQLPDKAPERPRLHKGDSRKKFGHYTGGDTLENVGNVYSGPYHSVQSPGMLYNQAPTMQLRESEYKKGGRSRSRDLQQEVDERTEAEVRKILSLTMPVMDYDPLGSDSDGDKYQLPTAAGRLNANNAGVINPGIPLTMQQQHEMITFRQRLRSDPLITSEPSTTSSDSSRRGMGGDPARKSSYFSRKHSKSKTSVMSGSSAHQRVRSSSGYSSHNEDTPYRIQPPSCFSDPKDPDQSDPEESGLTPPESPPGRKRASARKARHRGTGHQRKSGSGLCNRESPAYHINV